MPDATTPHQAPPLVVLVSTRVASTTGRPAYIVHAPGAEVPAAAPACPADCPTCRGRD